MGYTEQDILKNLDDITGIKMFPNFDMGYFYPANCRINLFGDTSRWAIVFEVVSYNNLGYNIVIDNYYFGNCIKQKDKFNISNMNTIVLSQVDNFNILNGDLTINPTAKIIKVRNKSVSIKHDISKYQERKIKGLNFKDPNNTIDIVHLVRYISDMNGGLLKATQIELKQNLPKNIPFIGVINEWHHENYLAMEPGKQCVGKKPSSYETFQLIAKCIVENDISLFKPKLKANSNWRNWPKAGTL